MNEDRTRTRVDTPLTQPSSGFDLEDTRRQLIATRVKHGANTPIGHRCSNIVEMLENGVKPPVIARQLTELHRLLGNVQ